MGYSDELGGPDEVVEDEFTESEPELDELVEPDLEPEPLSDDERPAWLPENFNDPADLAKSWREAQASLTRAQQEAAAERAAREALEEQFSDAFQRMLGLADERAASALRPEPRLLPPVPQQPLTAEQTVWQARQMLAAAHPSDWPEVAAAIDSRPDLVPAAALATPQTAAAAMESCYQTVKYEQRAAVAREREKQLSQSLAATPGRPAPLEPNVLRWQEIANAPSRSYRDLF